MASAIDSQVLVKEKLFVSSKDIFRVAVSKFLFSAIAISLMSYSVTVTYAQSENQSAKMILGRPASEVGDFNSPPKHIKAPEYTGAPVGTLVRGKLLTRQKPDSTESYMSDLQERIYTHWFPSKQAESKRAVVAFKLFRNGKISNLHILHSSGNNDIDKAAMDAVTNASPFAVLPKSFKEKMADVEFTFDYNVFEKGKKILENKSK